MTDSLYGAGARQLSIRATLTLQTGYAFPLTADDILDYRLTEGVQSGDMLLGSVLSAHGSLTLLSPDGAWKKGGSRLGDRSLLGATAEIEIGADSGSGFVFTGAGSFIVSAIDAPEGEDTLTVSGYDAVAHRFCAPFADTPVYPCTLSDLLDAIAAQAQCIIAGSPLCNADAVISAPPRWGEGCTLRRALSFIAGATGSFVRLSRSGPVEIVPVCGTQQHSLRAEDCFSLSLSQSAFSFNRLQVQPHGAPSGQYCEFSLDATLPAGADNTVLIDDNPLFPADSDQTALLVSALGQALSSLSFTPFSLAMPGDPTLETGTAITLDDLSGQTHALTIFGMHTVFADGLICSLSCEHDAAGVSPPPAFTSAGRLSSAALSDGVIAARHLAAGAVDAEKITARAITAEHIALGALTAQSGVIGALSADLITSGKLDTDRLIVGGTEFSIVRALNQLADSLSENDSSIDGGVISDRTISAVKVTDDFGAGLELSSNAAVLLLAGKLDGTNSHLELTQSAVNMVGGEINIATNDLDIRGMDGGDEIMSLSPEGLSARRVVVTGELSAPNAVTAHFGETAEWKGGIQTSLDALPRHLMTDCTLTVPAGIYEENVLLRAFSGAKLTVLMSPGTCIRGCITIDGCSAAALTAAAAGDVVVCPQEALPPVHIRHCRHVLLENLNISGTHARTTAEDGAACGIYVQGSAVTISGCCVEYTRTGIYLTDGATGTVHSCLGGCTGADAATNANLFMGVYADGGAHAALTGSVPMGGTANTGAENATLLGAPTALGGTADTAAGAVTATLYISGHGTCLAGHSCIRCDQSIYLSQGRYGEYAADGTLWRTGAMWFDGLSALQGKTVLRATLTLRRASGGWSNAVPVYLGTVAAAQTDFSAALQADFTPADVFPIGSLARESEGVYDVTSLIAALIAGHALGICEPRTEYEGSFSPAYTQFYGKGSPFEPYLTIEYQ